MKFAHIVGLGSYLPEHILRNEELAERLDSSDGWIQQRTGIRQRHIAAEEETTSLMGTRAARAALEQAGIPPTEVELIVVATCTPEYWFPSTACQIQGNLGAKAAAAFDISAACSGFVYALHMANQAVRTGSARTALVVGAERMSRVLDWQDRNTCVLFGDAAAAVVLQGREESGGILTSRLGADGGKGELLTLPVSYSSPEPAHAPHATPLIHNVMMMQGSRVFRYATEVLVSAIEDMARSAHLTPEMIDLIVPHQANVRIVEHAARRLDLPLGKFYLNVAERANTSSASIPLALWEAADAGRLRPGQRVLLVGFGGGMTWGASLVEWSPVALPPTWESVLHLNGHHAEMAV